jgi:hypothetical protein
MKAVLDGHKNLTVTNITIKKTKNSMCGCNINKKIGYRCWLLYNASSYDPQAHGSVVAFPLEYSPKVNQSMEQVECYAQLNTNVVDLKLFIKYV